MKTKLSIFILILLLLCTGCSFDDGPEPDGIDFQKVSLSQLSAYGLLEDGTLFYDRIKKNNYVEYYTYHFDTEEKKQLGFIDDFFLCVPSATLINQHLYFYVARSLNETTLENALYDVDLKQSSLQRIEKPDPSIAGVGIFSLKDKPVTLKNERKDSHVTTYIDVYDPTTKEWEKHLVNHFDENTKIGSAICVAYADNHSLYTIEDRYQDGTFNSYFVTYDENFQEIDSFIITGELKALLERGYRIKEFYVWNHYVYAKNLSNNGFLGYLEDNTIEEIYSNDYFCISDTLYPETEPIFFLSDTNNYFTLDLENKTLVPHYTKGDYRFYQWLVAPEQVAFLDVRSIGTIKQKLLESYILINKEDMNQL